MKFSFHNTLLLAALLLSAPALPSLAASHTQASGTVNSEKLPVTVNADTMSYEPEKNTVTFRGKVEAVRGDFILWSDKLTLYLKPAASKAAPQSEGEAAEESSSQASVLDSALEPGDLDRIVAENNVRFRYNTQNGTAQKATYHLDSATVTMEGQPILRDGENSITGHIIRYFLNENYSEVEGRPNERVNATFGSGSSPLKR